MSTKPITSEIKVASYASLLKESGKGCLLLAVGVFDKLLQNIIELAILANLKNKPPKDFLKLNVFGDNGTLHTFSSKINMAFAFCLISDDHFKTLHILRKVRNEAAHCYFEFSFRNPGVIAYLNKLEKYDSEAYREMFAKKQGVETAGKEDEKFDFVVRCYAVLMDLQACLLRQLERYAEVRGIKLSSKPGTESANS